MGAPSDQADSQTSGPSGLQRDITFDDEVNTGPRRSQTRPARRRSRALSAPTRGKSIDSEMDINTVPDAWTPEMEDRLVKAKADLWAVQKTWSADQEIHLKEVEELQHMKKAIEKSLKRRSKRSKRDGSRVKGSTSASTSQNVSDASDDEVEDSDEPPALRISSLFRRMSFSVTTDKDSDAISTISDDPLPHLQHRSQTAPVTAGTLKMSTLLNRRLSRHTSRSGISSEDTTDTEAGPSEPSRLRSRVLRRVSSSRSGGEDAPKKVSIFKLSDRLKRTRD
ncbi:MAG: hypothetical protein M1814_005426 [Vezdaea aestivalis]|nr:MAG: hypothetical protein M1814_005426 [Vezdaea aestivalis]